MTFFDVLVHWLSSNRAATIVFLATYVLLRMTNILPIVSAAAWGDYEIACRCFVCSLLLCKFPLFFSSFVLGFYSSFRSFINQTVVQKRVQYDTIHFIRFIIGLMFLSHIPGVSIGLLLRWCINTPVFISADNCKHSRQSCRHSVFVTCGKMAIFFRANVKWAYVHKKYQTQKSQCIYGQQKSSLMARASLCLCVTFVHVFVFKFRTKNLIITKGNRHIHKSRIKYLRNFSILRSI